MKEKEAEKKTDRKQERAREQKFYVNSEWYCSLHVSARVNQARWNLLNGESWKQNKLEITVLVGNPSTYVK